LGDTTTTKRQERFLKKTKKILLLPGERNTKLGGRKREGIPRRLFIRRGEQSKAEKVKNIFRKS